jgi:molecular chaperone DnaK
MRLAELMMDTAVTTALKGQNMDHSGMEGGPEAPHRISPAEIAND